MRIHGGLPRHIVLHLQLTQQGILIFQHLQCLG